ncbi:hypothetical protein ACWEFD_34415 [Streptomyces ardesiacus]
MHASTQTHRTRAASGPGITPGRVPHGDAGEARELLARDGAVVLTGHENTPDALVVAAAQIAGDRLRELYPLRVRTSRSGSPVHLLARLTDAVHDIEPSLPRFRLDESDILVLDNYRCWHGRDGHTGERTRILTARSSNAD